ncbi:MAG TPA: universal stress protein [Casimicrobiaceae bacterium]|nr:universal stress protein [Casimicrobiaceae bacterium]
MTFRSILVHLDDSAAGERRMDAAVTIARRFKGCVTAIYSSLSSRVEVDIEQLPPREVAKLMLDREARDRAEALLRRMAEAREHVEIQIRALGINPIDNALAEMRCADLAILSQPGDEIDISGFDRRLLEHALLGSGGPLLVLPFAPSTAEIGGNVVIAWDGSREAARAVRDALPLLATASRTTLLSIGNRCRLGEDAQRSQERVTAYLALHGVNVQPKRMESTLDDPGELLLSELCDLGADLLVMGAYGHARVRELVLGGMTRTMVEKMTVPLFTSH